MAILFSHFTFNNSRSNLGARAKTNTLYIGEGVKFDSSDGEQRIMRRFLCQRLLSTANAIPSLSLFLFSVVPVALSHMREPSRTFEKEKLEDREPWMSVTLRSSATPCPRTHLVRSLLASESLSVSNNSFPLEIYGAPLVNDFYRLCF